jgi:hypothetical protein
MEAETGEGGMKALGIILGGLVGAMSGGVAESLGLPFWVGWMAAVPICAGIGVMSALAQR